MRGGDEGSTAAGAGEDDVARLVADQQRAHDPWRRRREIDDADAVGEMVHHPSLAVAARGDRDRLESDRHGGHRHRQSAVQREDLQPVVGRVDGEQGLAVGRERERADLPALEVHEGIGPGGRRGKRAAERQGEGE